MVCSLMQFRARLGKLDEKPAGILSDSSHSSCFVNCNSSDYFFLDYIQRNECYSKLQTSRADDSFPAHLVAMLQRRRQRLANVAVIVILVDLRAYRIRHRKTMGESTCVSSKISATVWDERREEIERERERGGEREGGEETTFPRFFGFVSRRISLSFSISSRRPAPISTDSPFLPLFAILL